MKVSFEGGLSERHSPLPQPLRGWIMALALLLIGCGKSTTTTQPAIPDVTVSHPLEQKVADYIDLTGTVAPSKTVDLVARVSGYLRSVDFEDGTLVESGQVLFVIEPDSYEQEVDLTKAALQRAQSEYERQVGLLKENATSAANVERWLSERDQARAQLELAKLNLSYTRVLAPFAGRIGRRLVDPGNLVGPTVNTKLATLEQLMPIYVYFNLNERDALQIQTTIRQRSPESRPRVGQVPVFMGLQNQTGYPYEGVLDFVDIGLSPSSGTIQMRAVLKNEEKQLFPGLFARVRIPLGEPQPMLVVPQSALGNDQEGDFVLVAGPGDMVVRRSVTKGPLTRDGCAIRSGLTAQDRVIINGLSNARPGAKVRPVSPTSAAPTSPAPPG